MYLSMGHMMWNWPLPGILAENHVAMGILQLLLTGCVMIINQKFFVSGFQSLLHGAPNMDTLVALGSRRFFWIQHLCTVCHDRCADASGYGRSNELICMNFILNLQP